DSIVLDRLETTLRVRGGARLEGSVATHGAKNAALPIMAATLLAKGTVTLARIPRITDVSVMWSLLEALGARIRYEGDNTITIDSSNVASYRAPYALVRKLAASFDVVGPLLGRFGRAEVPLPGGCVLGTRATDMHEQAFLALGCEVRNAHGYLIAESPRRLQGAAVEFRLPSVGATKNAMLAASVAQGVTTLKNVAMEPEVVDLADFLVAMGARISGQGTDTIVIDGVDELHGTEYEIIPDRIVTGTLLLAGAVTRGDVTVTRCRPQHLRSALDKFAECGVETTTGDDWIRVRADGITGGTDVRTAPRIPNRFATANGRVSHGVSRHERRRRIDFQRTLLLRQRTRAHGSRRQGRDGRQHGHHQGRRTTFGRSRRGPRYPGRRGFGGRRTRRCRRDRDHRLGIHRPRLRAVGGTAFGTGRTGAAQQRRHPARRTHRLLRNQRIPANFGVILTHTTLSTSTTRYRFTLANVNTLFRDARGVARLGRSAVYGSTFFRGARGESQAFHDLYAPHGPGAPRAARGARRLGRSAVYGS